MLPCTRLSSLLFIDIILQHPKFNPIWRAQEVSLCSPPPQTIRPRHIHMIQEGFLLFHGDFCHLGVMTLSALGITKSPFPLQKLLSLSFELSLRHVGNGGFIVSVFHLFSEKLSSSGASFIKVVTSHSQGSTSNDSQCRPQWQRAVNTGAASRRPEASAGRERSSKRTATAAAPSPTASSTSSLRDDTNKEDDEHQPDSEFYHTYIQVASQTNLISISQYSFTLSLFPFKDSFIQRLPYCYFPLLQMSTSFDQPLDLLKQSLGEIVFLRTRNNSQIRGRLVCYDDHLNMMLSKLTITRPGHPQREHNLLYVRGDGIVLLSPDK